MNFFSSRNVVGAATSKNVLPDWWIYGFVGFEVLVLSGLAYQSLASPIQAFRSILPRSWDTETDEVKDSARIKIQGAGAGQCYLMILVLICGPLLFAKNALHGQPLLQQQLTTIVVGATLFSDVALWLLTAMRTPPKLFWSFSQWGDGQKGIFLYAPVGSLLKLVWLFGIGRDVV